MFCYRTNLTYTGKLTNEFQMKNAYIVLFITRHNKSIKSKENSIGWPLMARALLLHSVKLERVNIE